MTPISHIMYFFLKKKVVINIKNSKAIFFNHKNVKNEIIIKQIDISLYHLKSKIRTFLKVEGDKKNQVKILIKKIPNRKLNVTVI